MQWLGTKTLSSIRAVEGIQSQSLGASNGNNRAHIYTKVQASGSPVASAAVKESACKEGAARDRRSLGGGHGDPPQCFCPESPMDRGLSRVAESQTWLSDLARMQHAGRVYQAHFLPLPLVSIILAISLREVRIISPCWRRSILRLWQPRSPVKGLLEQG